VNIARVLNAFNWGSVNYVVHDTRLRQIEMEMGLEALDERVLREEQHEHQLLRIRFVGDQRDVVADWSFEEVSAGERFVETSGWYFAEGAAWYRQRETAKQQEPAESEELRQLRERLEAQLDAAGITDPKVRARMIEDALKSK